MSVWVDHPYFNYFIYFLIFANAILVGLETYPALYGKYGAAFHFLDNLLLWAFTLEIGMRLLSYRSVGLFFKSGWNLFDLVIVLSGHLLVGASYVTVLRILRVLRVLRAVSVIPSLRRMVNALMLTIPSLGHISLLLGILFYIYSVIGTMLYSSTFPEYFGNLQSSLLTLFQVVTLESWASGVMRPILDAHPTAWIYFVTFILLGTFIIMNLIVGVVVNNMEKVNEMELALERGEDPNAEKIDTDREIIALRREVAELKQLLIDHHKGDRKSVV